VLAVAVAGAALAVGVLAVRSPRPVIVQVEPAAAQAQPLLADPAPGMADPEPERGDPARTKPPEWGTENEMRRQLEPKVWAGQASTDEIRMLKAICSHQGDRACRDRAAKLLPRAKPTVF
jgi:hypothetical protein